MMILRSLVVSLSVFAAVLLLAPVAMAAPEIQVFGNGVEIVEGLLEASPRITPSLV
jgi:hypothetical protein